MAGGRKASTSGGGGGAASTDLKQVEKLQAVILADSSARKLRPATFDTPKALMPLANTPLIEYTLETLCAGGVEEVFVFCCHRADAVEAYLRTVEPRFAPAVLRCIASRAPCYSAGDALREVYEANVIQGDFVLAAGDAVTNVSLPALLAAHRAAREVDKNVLLTATFCRVPLNHRARAAGDTAVLAIRESSGQLLHYEPLPGGLGGSGAGGAHAQRVAIPTEVLAPAPPSGAAAAAAAAACADGAEGVSVRVDLLDVRLDVCTHEVLTLLVDNFDWSDLRADMLVSVLGSDILGKTVHAHEISAASTAPRGSAPFAARCADWRTFAELSADVLARWAFPLTPDANLLGSMDGVPGQPGYPPASPPADSPAAPAAPVTPPDAPGGVRTTYRLARGNAYIEVGVGLARSASIGVRVALGGGTVVGADARVTRSVVGRRCCISAGATVVDSMLWAGVLVGERATVRGAVLCDGVVVGAGATVPEGCVLGRGVVVGAGASLVPRTLYTRHAAHAAKGGGAADAASDAAPSWAEGADDDDDAFSDDDADDKASASVADAAPAPELGEHGLGFVHGVVGAYMAHACARPPARPPVEPELSDDGSDELDEGGSGADAFDENALDILGGMLEEGNAVDNIVLEVNALKFAYNRTVADCAAVAVRAILAHARALSAADGAGGASADGPARKATLLQLKKTVKRWAPLLARYVTSEPDQAELIRAVEELAEPLPWTAELFQYVLHALYDEDVLGEDAILHWADEAAACAQPAGSARAARVKACEQFLTWLREADEEEEDSDEDDD